MTDLFTTQPIGVASILMALALLLNVIARGLAPILAAIAEVIRNAGRELVAAIAAWTKRTNDERNCAPKLAAALASIAVLRAEFEEWKVDALAGGGSLEHVVVREERDDEPTGEPTIPNGIAPLSKKKRNP